MIDLIKDSVALTEQQLRNLKPRMICVLAGTMTDELKAANQAVGSMLGAYTLTAEESAELTSYTTNRISAKVWHDQLVTDNDLLARTIQYEKATARLDQYILLVGVTEVLHVEATYDEFGTELTPEVLYVAPIEALPEFVDGTTYDEDGNVTGTEEIRNPLVVQDEAERVSAQTTVDNTPTEALALAEVRGNV